MIPLPELVSYFHETLSVSIRVPVTWHGQLIDETQFRILAPAEPALQDYTSNMSYQRGRPEGHGDAWFEALIAQSGEDMRQDYHGFQLLGEERFMLSSGVPVYQRRYTWHDPTHGLHFSQLQALIPADQTTLYLINAATLQELEARYMPVFEAILRSTRIIPPAGL